jgi:hypothetical protein
MNKTKKLSHLLLYNMFWMSLCIPWCPNSFCEMKRKELPQKTLLQKPMWGAKGTWIDGPHLILSCLAEEVLIQKWLEGLKAPTTKTRQQSILRVNNSLILIQTTITNFHFMIQASPINRLKYQFNILINLWGYKLHQMGFFQTLSHAQPKHEYLSSYPKLIHLG